MIIDIKKLVIQNNTLKDDIKSLQEFFKTFNFIVLTGGVSNSIYLMIRRNEKYILRIYGNNYDNNNVNDNANKNQEIQKLLQLAEKNSSPQIYVIYNNARIEEYYEGIVLYDLDIDKNLDIYHNIISSIKYFHEHTKVELSDVCCSVQLIEEYIKKIHSDKNLRNIMKNYFPSFINNMDSIIDNFKNYCRDMEQDIVCCHNDLHHGNMIYNKIDKIVRFIDFEYFGKNPYYYDISNYFNELCGFECLWQKYPDVSKRYYFYKKYHNRKLTEKELKIIDKNVLYCSKINHIVWGLWGLVNSYSKIDFDYMRYYLDRIYRYYEI
jgi:ethanolamine kinase